MCIYDIKGTKYWKTKFVLKICIIITAGMINLVITVTLYKHQESHLPRNLMGNTQNRPGQKEQWVTAHQLFKRPMTRRMQKKTLKFY